MSRAGVLSVLACALLVTPVSANKRYPKLTEVMKDSLQIVPLGRGMLMVVQDRESYVCVIDVPNGFMRSVQTGKAAESTVRPTSFCFPVSEFDK